MGPLFNEIQAKLRGFLFLAQTSRLRVFVLHPAQRPLNSFQMWSSWSSGEAGRRSWSSIDAARGSFQHTLFKNNFRAHGSAPGAVPPPVGEAAHAHAPPLPGRSEVAVTLENPPLHAHAHTHTHTVLLLSRLKGSSVQITLRCCRSRSVRDPGGGGEGGRE